VFGDDRIDEGQYTSPHSLCPFSRDSNGSTEFGRVRVNLFGRDVLASVLMWRRLAPGKWLGLLELGSRRMVSRVRRRAQPSVYGSAV